MRDVKIHLGCGPLRLEGWVNVDLERFPAVDVLCDARRPLPFRSARYVFAEHFLEHLDLDDAIALLAECRRILAPEGVVRLTTPNLDWVWATAYASRWQATSETTAAIDPARWAHGAAAACDALELNKAFRGWGHRFLFNRAMLEETLRLAGFADVVWCAYRESAHPELAGLELHPRDRDLAGVGDLLIVEASGRGEHRSADEVAAKLAELRKETGSSARTTEPGADPRGVALAFVAAINRRSVDGILELSSPEPALLDARGAVVSGRQRLASAWRAFFGMFPDYRIDLERIFVAGDEVALFGRAEGTHAPGGTLDPARRFRVPAAWRASIEAGRVDRWQVFADATAITEEVRDAH